MKGIRQATVEPAWGTLTQFLGLRKINTLGLKQANKVVHMAACAYNLKKLLKYSIDKIESQAMTQKANLLTNYALFLAILDTYLTFLQIITRTNKMRIQLSIL